MRIAEFRALLLAASVLTVSTVPAEGSGDWPHLLGPHGTGVADAAEVFDRGDEFGFREAWRRPLGSGYSSLAAVGDRVFTHMVEGGGDWAVALDRLSGRELWRFRTGAAHRGFDGSDDGTIATPTVSDGLVFTLSPRGELWALRAATGEPVWSVDLVERFAAVPPYYGIASSPLVDGERLIVQVGGAGEHSLVAFDKRSGEVRWTSGATEGHSYASPALLMVEGERQVVALAADRLVGLDAESGELLWSWESDESEPDRLLALEDGRIFLALYHQGGTMLRVSRAAGGWRVEQLWRQPRLANSHGLPVVHGGAVYGFGGSLLVCLDAESGELLWRHRVYDGSLVMVDGRLLLLSRRSGRLHVIAPDRSEYRELGSYPVFEPGRRSITPPSFAGGLVLVRGLEQAVALAVVPGEQAPAAARVDRPVGSPLAERWRLRLERDLAPSGRAGVVATAERAYTLLADGEHDWALAIDAVSGRELWRARLDPLHPGARLGAVSTPALREGRLFVLSTACRLRALDAASGERLWMVDLLAAFGNGQRERGCETSPVAIGDRVVVQAAGESGHRVVALAAADGELVWSNGEIERPLYSSPVVARLDGEEQLLVHSYSLEAPRRSRLQGLAPSDGRLLWSHDLEGHWSFLPPVPVAGDRVLLPTWNRATMIAVRRDGESWRAEQLWQEEPLETAVRLGDEVCGARSEEVVCVDPADGRPLRTLATGFSRLTTVGGRIFALSYDGGVIRLLEPAGQALEEVASQEVLSPGAVNETVPVVADGVVYVRNEEELVAFDLR